MFAGDAFDVCGFGVGMKRWRHREEPTIRTGDKIIGLPSSGIHSNGYSLINDMLWRHKIAWADTPELLTPTTIYARQIEILLDEYPIVGMAHITGGGIEENTNRIMPEGLKAHIDWNSWRLPEVFSKIMLAGEIPEEEMKKTFNMGIGYCVVVPANVATDVQLRIHGHDMKSWVIGDIVSI